MPYTTVIVFAAFDPLPAADLNSNFANLDYLNNKINSQFILPAGSFWPSSTLGASAGTAEMSTNKNNFNFMDFSDTGGLLNAETIFPLPADYGGGTITFQVFWTANSASGNSVVWRLEAVACADDDALDVAHGTAVAVVDANKTVAYDLNITAVSGAVTIAGTPAAGELCMFRISRSSGNASDNFAATARMIAVLINYTRS